MKNKTRSLLASLALAGAAVLSFACAKNSPAPAAATPPAKPEARHPLRGVIVEVQLTQSGLLVKHEDIPGVMPAMTMLFKVDAATLKSAEKGRTITGTLVEKADGFWLEDVKTVAPAK